MCLGLILALLLINRQDPYTKDITDSDLQGALVAEDTRECCYGLVVRTFTSQTYTNFAHEASRSASHLKLCVNLTR
jgi:hypothetical protein